MNKKQSRLRRATKSRKKIQELKAIRLSVHRTPRHIYAQVIDSKDNKVLASASSVEKDYRGSVTGNADTAKKIGELIASRAIEKGVKQVSFDRSGFMYHGRIKALADAARESGLEF